MSIHRDLSFAEYKAANAITYHGLRMHEQCPLLYYQKRVARTAPDETPSDAMRVGAAAHCLILEGDEAYAKGYAVMPDGLDRRTKEGKAIYAELEASGKTVLKASDNILIERMALAVESNADAAKLLSTGWPEVTIRDNGGPVWVQGRLDWMTAADDIVDLKTCADLGDFARDIERHGYYRQLAFYQRMLVHERAGGHVPACYIIAVEKQAPYRCRTYKLTPGILDIGRAENTRGMQTLLDSYATNCWPGMPDGDHMLEVGPSGYLLERHAINSD